MFFVHVHICDIYFDYYYTLPVNFSNILRSEENTERKQTSKSRRSKNQAMKLQQVSSLTVRI